MTVQRLTPQEAYEKIQGNKQSAFIDVRSSMEFLFVGHPLRSTHIAWIDEPSWEVNPNFAEEVLAFLQQKFKQDIETTEVVLICRSGVRSVEAGEVLRKVGLENVYSVDEGFEGDINEDGHRGTLGGWRMRGLPWVQC